MSRYQFPKTVRILRRSDFRKVYDQGSRHSCPYFAAFCLKREAAEDGGSVTEGPKVGFTVTKALGKAVVRNRMKRRLREAVRLHLSVLPPCWMIVMNGRKGVLDAEFPALEREVMRLFARCANS
ncbi:MAG TPA: ribonuclease P protein component [Bryobacteraceae bacterium]|nr:ribonuclease P protein component [Bryobacteraceae bacterium]